MRRCLTGVAALAAALLVLVAASAARTNEQQGLVDKARITIEGFTSSADMASMRRLLKEAKGVLVVPQLLKAAFFVGGAGGSGVLLTREASGGEWRGPAFYTIGAGSFGLQFGGEASEVVLLFMTDRAVDAVLHNKVKLGAEVSAAVGPVGQEREAATTTNLRADIYSYSRNKGLFVGMSLEGAVIASREAWNESYYGRAVTADDILAGRVEAPGAAGLKSALARAEQ